MEDQVTGRRTLRTCDTCKTRKVRCSGYPGPCQSCRRRKDECHFSHIKPSRRPNVNIELTTNSIQTPRQHIASTNGNAPTYGLQDLYVDKILAQARTEGGRRDNKPFSVKGNEFFVGNYRLTFFSENRLQHISKQLRNNKVDELLGRISSIVRSRLPRHDTASSGSLQLTKEDHGVVLGAGEASTYIQAYFERAHPLHPFLERKAFEDAASSPTLSHELSHNKAWLALYHAVLALGCRISGGGSFEPGKGKSWRLFATSLAVLPDMLTLVDSITVLQALTTMAIYSLSISCLSIEHVILQEASRRVQNFRGAKLPDGATASYHKAFWVLYSLDKISSFHFGRTSMFSDHDIMVPIPIIPEAILNEFDWFLSCARYARLLSRAMTSLFSIGVTSKPEEYYLAVIGQLEHELENWRMSIPENNRPGDTSKIHHIETYLSRTGSVWAHLLYNSFRLSLCRARLQLAASSRQLSSASDRAESTKVVLEASRSVLELTVFIDVDPSTPFWFIGGIPVVSLFVIFDLVLSYPNHRETNSNLALLDVAGGHFSRIEYASAGWLPGSLITEFSYIAREYINSCRNNDGPSVPSNTPRTGEATSVGQQEMTNMRHESELVPSEDSLLQPALDLPQMSQSSTIGSQDNFLPDTLYFPMGDNTSQVGDGLFSGMDVIGLFNSSIPWVDPTWMYPLDGQEEIGNRPS